MEKDAKIKINVRRYDKEAQPLTHLTDGTLYPFKKDNKKNEPEARGLTPANNIKWGIPDKAIRDARGVKFKRINNGEKLRLMSYKKLKEEEQKLREAEEDAERLRILKERTDEQTREDEARRIKAEKLEQQLQDIGQKFNTRGQNLKLHEQKKGEKIEVIAFYRMDTTNGGTYIIYDKLKKTTYYANKQLNNYIEAILKNNYNVFNTRNKEGERAFYYITHETELITLIFTQIKELERKNDNKYAVLKNTPNYNHLQEDTKEEEQQLIERAKETILKAEQCDGMKITRDIETIDNLEENRIYYIKHIKKVKQAQTIKYILYLLNEEKTQIYKNPNDPPDLKPYKSNYYIEQQLNKIKVIEELNGQGLKAIQAGAVKLTPTKKYNRVITIKDI